MGTKAKILPEAKETEILFYIKTVSPDFLILGKFL